ncbi:Hypothetical protein, putative [Bodo saltans]|uniref:Uncharacterized protein n=1 Tax=Bodo saltans TaxID=75058 RepID=A0A0S4JVM7_BODSA|nr:Hypothetical protein, putative [Bodo saltans]|eukprot:CUG93493.1 Hypothetical protein, putative [Bodo saltans]
MLDISTSASTGIVDNLRFMGASHKESIQAPIGILRQDVTLSTQLQEYHRRRCVLSEYRNLITSVRASINGEIILTNDNPQLLQLALGGSHTNSRRESRSVSPNGNAPLPRSNFADAASPYSISMISVKDPLTDGYQLSESDSRAQSRATSTNIDDSRRLATTLFRAALSLHERYLPCYYCAKDILHEEFSKHLVSCKLTTESLMRKKFLNHFRFAEFVPQTPLPPLNCSDDVLEDYGMECTQCIGKSLVDCTICKRKFNIHELQEHSRRCTGRSSGEVLGNYTAYLSLKDAAAK